MSCHGRRPANIDIHIILIDGTEMMKHPTLNKTGKLDVDFPVDNVPCRIHVTVKNQFGSADTIVLMGKLKQYIVIYNTTNDYTYYTITTEDGCEPRVTDDKNSENSQ